MADPSDPATWATFQEAWDAYDSGRFPGIEGIGFVLTDADELVGFDLDHCYTESGDLEAWALDIINTLDTYTEQSPSGNGLHGYLYGRLPWARNRQGAVEFYESGRYLTITGNQLRDYPATIEHRQAQLEDVYRRYLPSVDATPDPPTADPPTADPATAAQDDLWDLAMRPRGAMGNGLDDHEVIDWAANSDMPAKGGLTKGERFVCLFLGGLDQVRPTLKDQSDSGLDMALINDLAYWTGGDPDQIDRLYRMSSLKRDKWDEMHGAQTYGQQTIDNVLRTKSDFYHGPPRIPRPTAASQAAASGTATGGSTKAARAWLWDDITAAFDPRPTRQYLIDGLFQVPSLTVPVGAPGDLKTMLMMDASICVAYGLDWLPPLPNDTGKPRAVRQAPVLWVDVDNGRDILLERFEALTRGHQVHGQGAPLRFVSFPDPPFIAGDSAGVDRIIADALSFGAKLLVIDNLGMISGGKDENSSEMIAVMAGLRRIAEFARAAVVVVHHRNKNGEGQNAIRGHTSIVGSVDTALLIEREPGSDCVTVQSTKTRGTPVEPFTALFTYLQHPADPRQLWSARFYNGGAPDVTKLPRQKQCELWLRQNWRTEIGDGSNQSHIIDVVTQQTKYGKHLVRDAIVSLVSKGYLTETQGANNASIYTASAKIP